MPIRWVSEIIERHHSSQMEFEELITNLFKEANSIISAKFKNKTRYSSPFHN